MAFPSVTEYYNSMYSSTLRKMGRKVIDQTFQKRPLFYWLYKKNKVTEAGGRSIQRQVQLREPSTAKAFGRGATFSQVDPDYIATANYVMRNVGDSLTRFWEDEQVNTGDSQIINLVTTNIKATVNGLEKKVQAMVWADTPGSIDISSVPHYVSTTPTTGTVAGIARSGETLWRNTSKTATGSAYTYLLDDEMDMELDIEKYGTVDYLVCAKDVFLLYNAIAREQKFITDKSMGDAEFKNVGWSGKPLTLDHDCADGRLYALNTDSWEFAVSPSADFKWTKWKDIPNSLDLTAQLVLRAQLINTRPLANGVHGSIAA